MWEQVSYPIHVLAGDSVRPPGERCQFCRSWWRPFRQACALVLGRAAQECECPPRAIYRADRNITIREPAQLDDLLRGA